MTIRIKKYEYGWYSPMFKKGFVDGYVFWPSIIIFLIVFIIGLLALGIINFSAGNADGQLDYLVITEILAYDVHRFEESNIFNQNLEKEQSFYSDSPHFSTFWSPTGTVCRTLHIYPFTTSSSASTLYVDRRTDLRRVGCYGYS